MSIINDIPWPMPHGGGPRGPRFQPPHPAAGQAPSILDILAEAATLHPPHPSVIEPGSEGIIQDIVNNPDLTRIPGEEVMNPAMALAIGQGASGNMPALGRTIREQVVEALLTQLDSEARLRPTLGRLMLRGSNTPTMDDIMGLEGGPPNLSSFFQGASPVDNPDVIQSKVAQLRSNLEGARPNLAEGERGALYEELSKQEGSVDPSYDPYIDQSGELADTHQIDGILSALEGLSNDQTFGPTLLDLINNGILSKGLLAGSSIDALITSGIGSGAHVPGVDNIGRRSLAPDLDPSAVGRELAHNPETDSGLLMRLMGLERQPLRRGV